MRCALRFRREAEKNEGTTMANAVFDGDPKSLHSFAEFYPFYLSEHRNATCRRLHFIGSTLVLICLWALIWTHLSGFAIAALVFGYGFAWIGHFAFEKNRPASFKRPLWSFMGDWRMYFDIWTGKIAM
jgi:hypothetical protein